MAIRKNFEDVPASGEAPAVDGRVLDPVTVAAMLDEHARLRSLLKDVIAATPELDGDYWVGMGVDEVAVRGESPETVMAAIEANGIADGTVVIELVSSEPQVFIL